MNLVFIITVSAIVGVYWLFIKFDTAHKQQTLYSKSIGVFKTVIFFAKQKEFKRLHTILHNQNLKMIEGYRAKEIVENSIPKDVYDNKNRVYKYVKHLTFQGLKYYFIKTKFYRLLIRDNTIEKPYRNYVTAALIGLLAILSFLYTLLFKSLMPLKKLEKEIKKFGNGSLDINTKSERDDEIATVANEFHRAVRRIKLLQQTRTLFMRNIMHELKTPITKGRLVTALLDENANKKILDNLFDRQETLVSEMADIEHLSTQDLKLDIKFTPLNDVIVHAMDLLFLNSVQICSNISQTNIKVDFNFFSIALKNLLDNAIKYSYDKHVNISFNTGSLYISNLGKPLEGPLEHYIEPFIRGEHRANGFGLGLYITSEIVKKHNLTLGYKYQDGTSFFIIHGFK